MKAICTRAFLFPLDAGDRAPRLFGSLERLKAGLRLQIGAFHPDRLIPRDAADPKLRKSRELVDLLLLNHVNVQVRQRGKLVRVPSARRNPFAVGPYRADHWTHADDAAVCRSTDAFAAARHDMSKKARNIWRIVKYRRRELAHVRQKTLSGASLVERRRRLASLRPE